MPWQRRDGIANATTGWLEWIEEGRVRLVCLDGGGGWGKAVSLLPRVAAPVVCLHSAPVKGPRARRQDGTGEGTGEGEAYA